VRSTADAGHHVGILDMSREARGAVLRREYEDAMARMRDANDAAKSAFLNNIQQTIEHVVDVYSAASESERKALLEDARTSALEMWNSGDWPSSLGLVISCLNAESRFTPGADAFYVKLATDQLIKEAAQTSGRAT
jgi:hypothetical protein